jgi:hypothetical protein
MSRKHSTAAGLATAAGGALAAAVLSMGTAHADTPVVDTYYDSPGVITAGDTTLPNDAYDMLFGANGTTAGTQGFSDNSLDVSTADSNLSGYEAFTNDVATFEETAGEHGLQNLIFAIDPSAFYEQTTTGVMGTVADSGGAYLVPDSLLGYLATGLDYGLLTPTGLDYVLTPLIDILTGQPFG